MKGSFYAPLPKMVPQQIAALRRRLESIGFRTAGVSPLRASKAGVTILVDSSGLCSSNEDLSDVIVPALPELLGIPPRKVSLKALRGSYFASERRGNSLLLRLSPRLETGAHWDELRSGGSCALTPDETAVYSAILESGASLTPLVTDFPAEGSAVRRIGRRQYYESKLGPSEAASTLRGFGSARQRNSYLPRNSILSLGTEQLPRSKLLGLFEELGEWCFLSLGKHGKSSIC